MEVLRPHLNGKRFAQVGLWGGERLRGRANHKIHIISVPVNFIGRKLKFFFISQQFVSLSILFSCCTNWSEGIYHLHLE